MTPPYGIPEGELTAQVIFDFVVMHMHRQDRNEPDNGQLRSSTGRSLGWGCLIPDEVVVGIGQGDTIAMILNYKRKHLAPLRPFQGLLEELHNSQWALYLAQDIYERALRGIARTHGLEINLPTEPWQTLQPLYLSLPKRFQPLRDYLTTLAVPQVKDGWILWEFGDAEVLMQQIGDFWLSSVTLRMPDFRTGEGLSCTQVVNTTEPYTPSLELHRTMRRILEEFTKFLLIDITPAA